MANEHDDERDDEHEDEHDGSESEPEALRVAPPPRRYVRTKPSAAPVLPLSPFGSLPANATHWSLRRKTPAGAWEVVEAPSPDGTIALREWPLSELSQETIRDRFGPGDYRLQWIGTSPNGGRAACGKSRDFRILSPPAPPQAAPPPPSPMVAPVLPPELQSTFALMGMLEQQATAKLGQLASMVQLFNGGARSGPDPSMAMLEIMREMMREQREASERQTAALVRALEGGGDDDDDDDRPGALASVASAGASAFRPGEPMSESLKAMFMNWAASNPDQAMGLLKEAMGAVGKLAGAIAPSSPAPASSAPARRVVVRQVAPPPAPVVEPPALADEHANGAAPASANEAYRAAASTPPASSAS